MKTLFIFFLFVIYMYSNTYGQSTNTKSDIGNSEYAGVYEGNLDVALCCDVYETGFGKIAFVFEGDSVNCLYDGKIIETLMPVNDLVKRKDIVNDGEVYPGTIFGRFTKDKNGKTAFLYNFEESEEHNAGAVSTLKKIGEVDLAKELFLSAVQEMNEFTNFESKFREVIFSKNKDKITDLINLPFCDKRINWDNPVIISNKNELKNILKTIAASNLSDISYKIQNSDKNFGGYYTVLADNIFYYFTKINGKFKLVSITGVFG